ncbi:SpoIIE family protein phosphatase, partial [bacterium]|nr:SpoIIE family protein phosphatase [bacterium]
LAEQGLDIQIEQDPQDADTRCDIVLWKLEKPSQIKRLPALRTRFERAWIAAIVPDDWLQNPETYADLLNCQEKNDVWMESLWEIGFWLGLQRAIQFRLVSQERTDFQEELEQFKEDQEEVLKKSAELVALFEKDSALTSDLHHRLYPRFTPDVPGVQVLSKYLPASGPGGDYFDLFEFADKRHFGLLLADSDTHRAAANLLSVLLSVRHEDLRGKFSHSQALVEYLQSGLLASEKGKGQPVRLLYGIFDRATLRFDLTVAGDIQGYLVRPSERKLVSPQDNPPLGSAGAKWKSHTWDLKPGDTLFFHTNGLPAALAHSGQKVEKVLEDLEALQDPRQVRNELLARIEAGRVKKALPDDTTFVLLSVDAKAMYLRPTLAINQSK